MLILCSEKSIQFPRVGKPTNKRTRCNKTTLPAETMVQVRENDDEEEEEEVN